MQTASHNNASFAAASSLAIEASFSCTYSILIHKSLVPCQFVRCFEIEWVIFHTISSVQMTVSVSSKIAVRAQRLICIHYVDRIIVNNQCHEEKGVCSFNKCLFLFSKQQFVHKKDHYITLKSLFV